MKKVTLSLILGLLLSACSVDSPISATQTFFKLIQDKNYQQACSMMVTVSGKALDESQLQSCIQYHEKEYSQLSSFTVENALPLAAEKLQQLGVDQGFVVYYTAKLNPEVKHEDVNVVKVSGKHTLVWEN